MGLKALKDRLREYVRLATGAQTVLVGRQRVVAGPALPRPGRTPLLPDTLLADAIRGGSVTPALAPQAEPPPRQPVARLAALLDELAKDREPR